MAPSNWLRSLRNTRECNLAIDRVKRRKAVPQKLNLESLEDRLAPATVTLLGSQLVTSSGQPEGVFVSGVNAFVTGTDTAFNAQAGTYSVLDTAGQNSFGTFTVLNQDTISATTGALVATGNTIGFDLTKLAAVTVNVLTNSAGNLQEVNLADVEVGNLGSAQTFYIPAGTYILRNDPYGYGSFTVAGTGQGSFTISGTTGALVATGNTISIDPSQLAAITINVLTNSAGILQEVNLAGVEFGNLGYAQTFYVPAGTYVVRNDPYGYGSLTVTGTGQGSFTISGTTGALVATGNTISIDPSQLAAITINVLTNSAGILQEVNLAGVEFGNLSYAQTFYVPDGTYVVRNDPYGYGSFTVAGTGPSSFTISGTTGALVVAGNTITIDPSQLAPVTINDLNTSAGSLEQVNLAGVEVGTLNYPQTFYLPAGTYTLRSGVPMSYGTFTVTPTGSGSFLVGGTTGALVAAGNTVDFEHCALDNVTINPNYGVGWQVIGVTTIDGLDTVLIPDGTYTIYFYGATGGAGPATFSVGPSGLSDTRLPQNNPLVTLQLVPCQDATTTTVTASVNPSMLNQTVTFTANVSAADGDVPTGTVQFLIDNVNFGSPVTLANGSAGITTAGLTAGPHTIQAVYGGNSDFVGSTGSLTQNVQYCFDGFRPPLSQNLAFALNRTIPIKWQLCDFNGALITSLDAVTSLQIAPVNPDNSLGTPFNPTPTGGTSLRNDGSQYVFNWQTKGLAAGTYEILLTLSDGTLHTKLLQLSKNGSSAGLTTVAAGGTGTAPGGLLGGDISLYVDNTNGDLTADELARIQDAVTAADAVTEPYGVAVAEVTDPTLADVTLNMDTTSSVGGYAAGVLGCTTDAGLITIINGWNFYAGSDATQIGSPQYDFETVVTHELGHALGLGHSTDATSVMYATLNTGTVNRTLTTADLNVADTDTTGACGLHAVLDVVGRISKTFYPAVVLPGKSANSPENTEQNDISIPSPKSSRTDQNRPLPAVMTAAFLADVSGQPAGVVEDDAVPFDALGFGKL
jgi:hypothetical protein